MTELPLFPLNTVLFPGQPMSLHIFEERYKEMIGLCIETQQPFGIVLLESGNAEQNPLLPPKPVKPYEYGCTAQITQVQRLAAGRLNITVVGRERFKILETKHDKPYLVGVVEMSPIDIGDSAKLGKLAARLSVWIDRYLKVLEKAGQLQTSNHELPTDPITLAYLGCVLLHGVEMEQKQDLLESTDIVTLTRELSKIYRREAMLLEVLLNPPDSDGPFSLN